MQTWTELRAAFYDIIGDPDMAVVPVATAERWSNNALYDICQEALYVETASVQNVVAGTYQYSVSDQGYGVFRVEYDGEALLPITSDAFRQCQRDWSYRTGVPKYYYLDNTQINVTGAERLYVNIYYKPSSSLASGLRVWYWERPDDNDNDSPSASVDVPKWAIGAVLYHMLAKFYESQYGVGSQNFEAASIYRMMYEDIKDRLVARCRNKLGAKTWVAGQPARPPLNVLNRLPDRVPAP